MPSPRLPPRRTRAKVWSAPRANAMPPRAGNTFPLERFADAVQESLKDARGGKVLIRLN